jgi:pyruvate/2-oxoglutarate dehydrogenase complex dihydrolipoamide dehydrogenase (E3) component
MKPDVDLAVLGGGTAGLSAAVVAAELGARVALVERERTGGDCLWTGCVPSKSLIESAGLAHRMRHAEDLGLTPVPFEVDLGAVLDRVRAVQARIQPHDSPERLAALGVEVVADSARFLAPRRLGLAGSGRKLTARAVLVATGSQPLLPPIEGLAEAEPLTTDTVWDAKALPERLVVLGGGPVGCELSQAFARLGSKVTIVEMAERLLPSEDPEAGQLLADRFAAEGVAVHTNSPCIAVTRDQSGVRLALRTPTGEVTVEGDELLVALGRRPRTAGLGLDTAGIRTGPDGSVAVDRRMRTSARGVYAAGDVTAKLPFTHVAAYQAGVAALNALLPVRRSVSYRAVPYAVFTDPEVAHVGLNEQRARERWGARTVVARHDYRDVDRAVTAATPYGFAKLVGDPKGRLVGATVAAPAAGEVIGELAALVSRKAGVGDVFKTVHPYPTFALGAAMAGAAHLRARFLTDRTRRIVKPLLGVLRSASRV